MNRGRYLSLIIITTAFIAAGACASANDKPPETADDHKTASGTQNTAAATGNEESAEPEPVPYAGTWQNGSCGTRKYLRRITFHEDGRFEAADLVAPCPPNAKCVWSGVVNWQGTFTLEDDRFSLDITTQVPERPDSPVAIPESFVVLSTDPYVLAEESSEGMTCPYTRTP